MIGLKEAAGEVRVSWEKINQELSSAASDLLISPPPTALLHGSERQSQAQSPGQAPGVFGVGTVAGWPGGS